MLEAGFPGKMSDYFFPRDVGERGFEEFST
jgi:hypothetical protein